MAFNHRPRDLHDPAARTPPMWIANVAPFFFAAIAVIVLVALFLPGDSARVADNNAGPKTVTLSPSPSPAPTPKPATRPTPDPTTEPTPTTEPRPTQAPIE